MRRFGVYSFLIVTAFSVDAAQATLAPPFDTPPFTVDAVGPSAFSEGLGSFQRPSQGLTNLAAFIGAHSELGAGSLILDFDTPFTDGDGDDFAILTSSLSWGSLADQALFQFFLAGKLVGSFVAGLEPDQLFTFDLPGEAIIADRVVVTNITPDPPDVTVDTDMTFIDAGVVATPALDVAFDVKPRVCPNTINTKAKGVLRAAILGAANFDVTEIDPETVRLEGVPPLRFDDRDVATPFVPFAGKEDPFDCTDAGRDGFRDIRLTFDNRAISDAIGSASQGEVRVLKMLGKLHDGTLISGEEVVVLRK